jgi:teichuronic acid biosynthesis glycosyltransferase TuaC
VVSCPVGGVPEVVDQSCAMLVPPRDAVALAGALASALDRDWDESALSRRYSRSWAEVAAETHAACVEAQAMHAIDPRVQPE